jgi:hypothetical protein
VVVSTLADDPAKADDPANDGLTYEYLVTGGKILGEGAKVVWDLHGVDPGNYTITAGVNDGCGICGKTVTKSVVVKTCQNNPVISKTVPQNKLLMSE